MRRAVRLLLNHRRASEQFLREKMSACAPTQGRPSSCTRILSSSLSFWLISILITFMILMHVAR